MELIRLIHGLQWMMDLTEKLYRFVAQRYPLFTTITYKGVETEMDLGKPFARITMVDAVKKYAGVDFDQIHTLEEAEPLPEKEWSLRGAIRRATS